MPTILPSLKRPSSDSFFTPISQRQRRSGPVYYVALDNGTAARLPIQPYVAITEPITISNPNSPENNNEEGTTIIVDVPIGHEDYPSDDEDRLEEINKPEFAGLTLEQRKIAVQTWFRSREKHEERKRNKSSHVCIS